MKPSASPAWPIRPISVSDGMCPLPDEALARQRREEVHRQRRADAPFVDAQHIVGRGRELKLRAEADQRRTGVRRHEIELRLQRPDPEFGALGR